MCLPAKFDANSDSWENDIIYFRENCPGATVYQERARLNACYYNVESLATEIQRAMNEVTNFPQPYEVTYNSRIGRYEFRNMSQRFGFATLTIAKKLRILEQTYLQSLISLKMVMGLGGF